MLCTYPLYTVAGTDLLRNRSWLLKGMLDIEKQKMIDQSKMLANESHRDIIPYFSKLQREKDQLIMIYHRDGLL
jgi:hypothetical protein